MKDSKKHLRRNLRYLYINEFFTNSYFTLPINLLFGKQYLGVSYFAAGALVFTNRLVSFLFDFLGGVVADKIGRKEANILGLSITATSFVPFLLTKSYPVLLVSMAINGIGLALSSNSIDALIYEEAKELNELNFYQKIVGNSVGFFFAGRFYASILGGLTFIIDARLPYLLTIIALLFALLACKRITINKRVDTKRVLAYSKIVRQAVQTYRSDHRLLKFILLGGLFSMWGNMLFVYYQPLFTQLHVSTGKLGLMFAVISIGSAGGALLMRKLPNHIAAENIQSIELLGTIATAGLLMLLHLPFLFAVPLVLSVMSGFQYPNMRIYVNKITADSVRSSVLSAASSFYDAGLVIGLGISYFMADHFSKNLTLSVILIGTTLTLLANYLLLPNFDKPGGGVLTIPESVF